MRTLAALAVALVFGGCAKDNEDRAFFNEGWVNPEEGATRRLYRSQVPLKGAEERKQDER